MSGIVRIEGSPDLIRDKSGAVLNTNKDALEAYLKDREFRARAVNVATEIDDLKRDVGEIKTLLLSLINKTNIRES